MSPGERSSIDDIIDVSRRDVDVSLIGPWSAPSRSVC
jgi:hypothetical protein